MRRAGCTWTPWTLWLHLPLDGSRQRFDRGERCHVQRHVRQGAHANFESSRHLVDRSPGRRRNDHRSCEDAFRHESLPVVGLTVASGDPNARQLGPLSRARLVLQSPVGPESHVVVLRANDACAPVSVSCTAQPAHGCQKTAFFGPVSAADRHVDLRSGKLRLHGPETQTRRRSELRAMHIKELAAGGKESLELLTLEASDAPLIRIHAEDGRFRKLTTKVRDVAGCSIQANPRNAQSNGLACDFSQQRVAHWIDKQRFGSCALRRCKTLAKLLQLNLSVVMRVVLHNGEPPQVRSRVEFSLLKILIRIV